MKWASVGWDYVPVLIGAVLPPRASKSGCGIAHRFEGQCSCPERFVRTSPLRSDS